MNIEASLNPNLPGSRRCDAVQPPLHSRLLQMAAEVRAWRTRIGYRRELRRILETGPHLVADMGIGIDEALHEIAKPFYIA